jgi:hypothetical protein
MKQNGPARDEAPQRDPLLEEAFTHFVQQAQAPAEFAERVRARVNLLPPEGWLRSWARHIATALAQASGRWKGPRAIGREEIQWRRPRTSRVRLGWLVTGLVLSVLGNVWLGVQLRGKPGADDTRLAPARAAGPSQETREIRLAFTDGVREQALRKLLLSLRATIVAGPSPEGVYTVLVPLPRLRGIPSSQGVSNTADALRRLIEELRAEPDVRLAEPVPPN